MALSTQSSSVEKAIRHFLSDPNDAPAYGFQDNAITGMGFWLMQGARIAISVYDKSTTTHHPLHSTVQKAYSVLIAILTSPLTLLGALMKGIGSQFPHKVENLTIDKIAKTHPAKIDQIYDLLQIANTLFREKQIDYLMDGGTLLGAIRHQGIIEWDDDADLIVLEKDKNKLIALKDGLRKNGVILQDTGLESFKMTFDPKIVKERFGVSEKFTANLDIFIVHEAPDGKIRPKSEFYKHQFPKEYFSKEEWEHPQDYPFGPLEKRLFLKGPSEPMRYLKTFYGPECFDYAIQTHSHIQLGPVAFPILNFSKTRYKIINPTFAKGNLWK